MDEPMITVAVYRSEPNALTVFMGGAPLTPRPGVSSYGRPVQSEAVPVREIEALLERAKREFRFCKAHDAYYDHAAEEHYTREETEMEHNKPIS